MAGHRAEGTPSTGSVAAVPRPYWLALVLAVALYLGLAAGNALTERPGIDEGFFAGPAYTLATQGYMGSTVIDDTTLPGVHDRTYWIMPLHPLMQAGWYRLLGFSLFTMRLLSMFWGLVALLSAWVVVERLLGDRRVALLSCALLAVDYHFVAGAASGRMDMMCMALGLAGIAGYLWLRERSLGLALLAGHAGVALSGLTHPNGLLPLLGLMLVTVSLDWRRLRLTHLLPVVAPYVVFGAAYGVYIAQDPASFTAQFRSNASTGDRWSGLRAPWLGIYRELTLRYGTAYGLRGHSAGHAGPIYLKSLVLLAYVGGIAGVLLRRDLRARPGVRLLLWLAGLYFLFLALWDGQKAHYYLVQPLPFYVMLMAVFAQSLLAQARWRAWALAGLAGLALLQAGGLALRMRSNTYGTSYAPAVAFLRERAVAPRTLIASSAFGFGLGFPENQTDDITLGLRSGLRPDFIVIDGEYAASIMSARDPAAHAFAARRLTDEYVAVYDQGACRIYARR